jgi:hypothetical protein
METESIENHDSKSLAKTGYARPKTRGELRDLLKDGIPCEVVSSNVSITSALLRGWLDFDSFTFRQSETPGWSVFEAEPYDSRSADSKNIIKSKEA